MKVDNATYNHESEDNIYEKGICRGKTFCKAGNGLKLGVDNFF